jgi:hypothetical protein
MLFAVEHPNLPEARSTTIDEFRVDDMVDKRNNDIADSLMEQEL